jgi:hypothetical protein
MPGQKKCLEYTGNFGNDKSKYNYFRNLKEFIINKNGKYCLWGSKDWDEECQDASMQYAYGDYGRCKEDAEKFKKIVINFIKHIQNNEIDKALKLTCSDAMFFTDDDNNCLAKKPNIWSKNFLGCRSYFNKSHEDKARYDDFNMEEFRENLMQIDVDHLKFFLSDPSQRMIYTVVIPYEYQNLKKEFSITFYFSQGSWEKRSYSGQIYDVSIYNINKSVGSVVDWITTLTLAG